MRSRQPKLWLTRPQDVKVSGLFSIATNLAFTRKFMLTNTNTGTVTKCYGTESLLESKVPWYLHMAFNHFREFKNCSVVDFLIGFNAEPDPAFYLNADPDPDPGSRTNAEPCGSGSWLD
jgi:hypothetical protein